MHLYILINFIAKKGVFRNPPLDQFIKYAHEYLDPSIKEDVIEEAKQYSAEERRIKLEELSDQLKRLAIELDQSKFASIAAGLEHPNVAGMAIGFDQSKFAGITAGLDQFNIAGRVNVAGLAQDFSQSKVSSMIANLDQHKVADVFSGLWQKSEPSRLEVGSKYQSKKSELSSASGKSNSPKNSKKRKEKK